MLEISKTIRDQVMFGNADEIRKLLLTKNQIALVNLVKDFGGITSSKMVSATGISLQDMSTRLARLESKGYLSRSSFSSESGGIEYLYTSIVD